MQEPTVAVVLFMAATYAVGGSIAAVPATSIPAGAPSDLAGRWDFDDGTGKDLSGHGADASLGGTRIYPLGEGHACVEILPGDEPLRIPASY